MNYMFASSSDEVNENSNSRVSHEGPHQENLLDFDDENFVDGRIPEANISSYNSHQNNKKLAF